jgi:hypothetical protein
MVIAIEMVPAPQQFSVRELFVKAGVNLPGLPISDLNIRSAEKLATA